MDRVQFRRDTAANWQMYNPVLMEGEMGLVTDNPNQYKIGDGTNAWNDLPLRGYNGTIAQELGDDEDAVVSQKTVTRYIYDNNRYANIFVKYPIFNTKNMTFTLETGTRLSNYKLGYITLETDVVFDVSDIITTWSVWYLILDSSLNKRYVRNIDKVLLSSNEAIIALVRFSGGNGPDVLCMFSQGLIRNGVTILNNWSASKFMDYCTVVDESLVQYSSDENGSLTLKEGTIINGFNGFKTINIVLDKDIIITRSDEELQYKVYYIIISTDLSYRLVRNQNDVSLSEKEVLLCLIRFTQGILASNLSSYLKDGETAYNYLVEPDLSGYDDTEEVYAHINKYPIFDTTQKTFTLQEGTRITSQNFDYLQTPSTIVFSITEAQELLSTTWNIYYLILDSSLNKRYSQSDRPVKLKDNEAIIALVRFQAGEGPSIYNIRSSGVIIDGKTVLSQWNKDACEFIDYAVPVGEPKVSFNNYTLVIPSGLSFNGRGTSVVINEDITITKPDVEWQSFYVIISNTGYRLVENRDIVELNNGELVVCLLRFSEGILASNLKSYIESNILKTNVADKCVKNWGKSIGVFGGSLSVNTESQAAKNIWKANLGVTVTNYGVGGAGFSSLQGKSIQTQVDEADSKDIYILWASTNDYTNNRECGTWKDYTALDDYNESKLVTQCGGINYCIKKLLEKNPKAEIYFFTSLRFFSLESGYNPFSETANSTGKTFAEYVAEQKKCCEYYNIPVLDQFNLQGINEFNYANYYNSDKVHMNEEGYKKIGYVQAEFLKNGLN